MKLERGKIGWRIKAGKNKHMYFGDIGNVFPDSKSRDKWAFLFSALPDAQKKARYLRIRHKNLNPFTIFRVWKT